MLFQPFPISPLYPVEYFELSLHALPRLHKVIEIFEKLSVDISWYQLSSSLSQNVDFTE